MHHRLLLCHASCWPQPQGQEVSYPENVCTYCTCPEGLLGGAVSQLGADGALPLVVLQPETWKRWFPASCLGRSNWWKLEKLNSCSPCAEESYQKPCEQKWSPLDFAMFWNHVWAVIKLFMSSFTFALNYWNASYPRQCLKNIWKLSIRAQNSFSLSRSLQGTLCLQAALEVLKLCTSCLCISRYK